MTREFKFRFWDEEMKDYWDWEEMQDDWESDGYFTTAFRQDHWVCEQFTGLYDKNGKEIYEGDIIKSPSNKHPLEIIRHKNGMYIPREYRKNGNVEICLYQIVDYGVEVIGNIHENKELLND